MEDTIIAIVKKSINAPSGDNCQPWEFSVAGNILSIFRKQEGNTYLDFEFRGTHFAHGALIENIRIFATMHHYRTLISYFPDGDQSPLVATLMFQEDRSLVEDPLAAVIAARTTNRKPYKKLPLNADDRESILRQCTDPSIAVSLVEDGERKRSIFTATTQMERIALQNKFLHTLFFDSIVWTKAEEMTKKSGLYLKTMELPPPVQLFFRLLKRWKVAQFLQKIEFSKKVGEMNAKNYQSSAAAIVFSIDESSPTAFVRLGQEAERVWLVATARKISVQPLAGLIYVRQRLTETTDTVLTAQEQQIITESYSKIESTVQSKKNIGMIFRLGYDGEPSARSTKKEPIFRT